jgi:death-on-curing protein
LATDETVYLSYAEAVLIHLRLMRALGETRYGVDFRELVESALARPQHAATYENADIFRQAASLLFGLIKNHPWLGGNKRTATALLQRFLELNGYRKNWAIAEQVELVLLVEADAWKTNEIENWLRERVTTL